MSLTVTNTSTTPAPIPIPVNSLQRTAYRRDVLKLPGPVDRWLISNSRSPRVSFLSDYLMISDTREQYVVCVVEVESSSLLQSFNNPGDDQHDKFTLFLTAYDPTFTTRFRRRSPRIVLEQFFGFQDSIAAPEWASRRERLEFQQPRATFAELFWKMASWDANTRVPGLSYEIEQWAKSLKAGSDRDMTRFMPVTPLASRILVNVRDRENLAKRSRVIHCKCHRSDGSPTSCGHRKRRRTLRAMEADPDSGAEADISSNGD